MENWSADPQGLSFRANRGVNTRTEVHRTDSGSKKPDSPGSTTLSDVPAAGENCNPTVVLILNFWVRVTLKGKFLCGTYCRL